MMTTARARASSTTRGARIWSAWPISTLILGSNLVWNLGSNLGSRASHILQLARRAADLRVSEETLEDPRVEKGLRVSSEHGLPPSRDDVPARAGLVAGPEVLAGPSLRMSLATASGRLGIDAERADGAGLLFEQGLLKVALRDRSCPSASSSS